MANGGSDAITVTINVVDLLEPNQPAFTEGDNTTRSIAEKHTVRGKHRGVQYRLRMRMMIP